MAKDFRPNETVRVTVEGTPRLGTVTRVSDEGATVTVFADGVGSVQLPADQVSHVGRPV